MSRVTVTIKEQTQGSRQKDEPMSPWMSSWCRYWANFERRREEAVRCKEPMAKIPPEKNCKWCGLTRDIHQ